MVKVTAATSFLGDEGMWRAGDTKEVSNHRAEELIQQGFVIEAADQGDTDLQAEPTHVLQPVADALGASIAEPLAGHLAATAEALGATVEEGSNPDDTPIADQVKEQKSTRKTKEEKTKPETKDEK